jgi:hypothetical protein
MDEGGVDGDDGDEDEDDPLSEHSSELSGDGEGMEEEDHDDVDDEHEDSIIDMLEEQHMEEQVDRADGWTTDSDSPDDEEGEMDDEEDANDELIQFGPVQFHPMAGDGEEDDGGDYSEEEMDEGADMEDFREMVGNLRGQFFPDHEEDEEEDEDEHDHHHFHGGLLSINGRHYIRPGAPSKSSFQDASNL